MSRKESRNHDEQEYSRDRKHNEKIRIEAYKGVDEQERECMRRLFPTEQALDLGLELENDPDPMGFSPIRRL
jgi:hypothetical protein